MIENEKIEYLCVNLKALNTTVVILNFFSSPIKSLLLQMFGSRSNTYGSFLPIQVVGCSSETQLQLGENLSYLIWRFT